MAVQHTVQSAVIQSNAVFSVATNFKPHQVIIFILQTGVSLQI